MSVAFQPRSLEEALELRRAHPEAVPVAGGSDLMVEVNLHGLRPAGLLDLSRVPEPSEVSRGDGLIRVGTGMTFARIARELAEFRPLAQAAHSFASPTACRSPRTTSSDCDRPRHAGPGADSGRPGQQAVPEYLGLGLGQQELMKERT